MKRDSIATARMLSEALPHIQRHDGSIVVIKLGGHAISSNEAMNSFARDIGIICNSRRLFSSRLPRKPDIERRQPAQEHQPERR